MILLQLPNIAREAEKYAPVSQQKRKRIRKMLSSNAVLLFLMRVKVLLLRYFFQRNGHTN